MGLGISASIGRALGALAPILLYELFLFDKWLIFLFFGCLTIVFLSATLTFPIDLTNRPLDEDHHGESTREHSVPELGAGEKDSSRRNAFKRNICRDIHHDNGDLEETENLLGKETKNNGKENDNDGDHADEEGQRDIESEDISTTFSKSLKE